MTVALRADSGAAGATNRLRKGRGLTTGMALLSVLALCCAAASCGGDSGSPAAPSATTRFVSIRQLLLASVESDPLSGAVLSFNGVERARSSCPDGECTLSVAQTSVAAGSSLTVELSVERSSAEPARVLISSWTLVVADVDEIRTDATATVFSENADSIVWTLPIP